MSLGAKGDALEFDVARYFQAQGYVVRRGVTLSAAAGTADVTDIDLVAIRFASPLTEHRVIADCKDRKRPRPFERVLWTAGLARFASADQAIVVSPRAPWQAREFAAQAEIEILGTESIESFLAAQGVDAWRFSDADLDLYERKQAIVRRALGSDRDFLKNLQREEVRLRQLLVVGHPITNFNRVLRTLSRLGATKLLPKDSSLVLRAFCADAIVIACVMLVRFAAESKWTPEHDWVENARKRLTYGDVSPQKARQLAKIALERNFYDGLPEPDYADEIVELTRTLIRKPEIAALTPYALDMTLFGQGLGVMPDNAVTDLLGRVAPEVLNSAKRVVSSICYAAKLPSSFLASATIEQIVLPPTSAPSGFPLPLVADGAVEDNGSRGTIERFDRAGPNIPSVSEGSAVENTNQADLVTEREGGSSDNRTPIPNGESKPAVQTEMLKDEQPEEM